MDEKFSKIHNDILQQVANLVFMSWERIYILGEVEKTPEYQMCQAPPPMLRTSFYYTDSATNETCRGMSEIDKYMSFGKSKDCIRGINNTIYELNKIFRTEADGDWSKIWDAFTLIASPNGQFSIDYHYEFAANYQIITNKYNLEKEFIWAYETFGYKPKESHPFRRDLDNYLLNELGKNV